MLGTQFENSYAENTHRHRYDPNFMSLPTWTILTVTFVCENGMESVQKFLI